MSIECRFKIHIARSEKARDQVASHYTQDSHASAMGVQWWCERDNASSMVFDIVHLSSLTP